jgi:small subunit ribosomal protein S3
MSKIVHPYAHRLVILRDWKSRWFATKDTFVKNLKMDVLLREFLMKKLRGSYIAGVEFERNQKATRIIIRTSRPGMVIGRSGENSIKLKGDVVNFLKKHGIKPTDDLKIDVVEVQNPDADAHIVAYAIAEALEKRMTYRRVMKQMIEKVMAVRGVEGARIVIGGRLGGAEIARSEELKRGSIPLQTFRADIDYARERAHLSYGDIGIKVWIYRGEIFNEVKK